MEGRESLYVGIPAPLVALAPVESASRYFPLVGAGSEPSSINEGATAVGAGGEAVATGSATAAGAAAAPLNASR